MKVNKSVIVLVVLLVAVLFSLVIPRLRGVSKSVSPSDIDIDYDSTSGSESGSDDVDLSSSSGLSNESVSTIPDTGSDTAGSQDLSSTLQDGVGGDPSLFTVQNDDIVSTAVMYYVSGVQDDAILSVIDDTLLDKQGKLLGKEPYATLVKEHGNLVAEKKGDVVAVRLGDNAYKFRVRFNEDVTKIILIKYLGKGK